MRMRSVFLLLALLPLHLSRADASYVYLVSSDSQIEVGESTFVFLMFQGDGSPQRLAALDIMITYDPTILMPVNHQWGTGLDVLGLGSIRSLSPDLGLLSILELSLDTVDDLELLQPLEFDILTIQFLALANGLSELDIQMNSFSDSFGEPIYPQGVGTSIRVGAQMATVPEPVSGVLVAGFLSAFVLLRCLRSRPKVCRLRTH